MRQRVRGRPTRQLTQSRHGPSRRCALLWTVEPGHLLNFRVSSPWRCTGPGPPLPTRDTLRCISRGAGSSPPMGGTLMRWCLSSSLSRSRSSFNDARVAVRGWDFQPGRRPPHAHRPCPELQPKRPDSLAAARRQRHRRPLRTSVPLPISIAQAAPCMSVESVGGREPASAGPAPPRGSGCPRQTRSVFHCRSRLLHAEVRGRMQKTKLALGLGVVATQLRGDGAKDEPSPATDGPAGRRSHWRAAAPPRSLPVPRGHHAKSIRAPRRCFDNGGDDRSQKRDSASEPPPTASDGSSMAVIPARARATTVAPKSVRERRRQCQGLNVKFPASFSVAAVAAGTHAVESCNPSLRGQLSVRAVLGDAVKPGSPARRRRRRRREFEEKRASTAGSSSSRSWPSALGSGPNPGRRWAGVDPAQRFLCSS